MITLWVMLASIVVVVVWTVYDARRADGRMPLDNLPVVFLMILVLYAVLPPLSWLIQGGEILSILNGRLYFMQPTLAEQQHLTMLGLILAVGVASSRWLVPREYRYPAIVSVKPVTQKIVTVCFMIVAVQFVLMNLLRFAGIIRPSESYADSYLVIQELPLLLRQGIKILGGLAFFSKLTILVYLFQRWRTHKKWVYAFLLFTIVSIDPEGGRGGAFIMMFASLILWNRYVKPLTFAQLIAVGSLGIVAFTALGIYRSIVSQSYGSVSFFEFGMGEFDGLWANAVELYRGKLAGQRLPTNVFFSELYAPIPSNFLPFEKMDYANWYLDEYYPDYKLLGGGWMFGLLAQVAAGFGAIEALVRGLLIGVVLGWLTHYLGRCAKWWHYPALLYCAVWTFQTMRDSSLALITPFIQIALISAVVIGVTASLLPGKSVSAVPAGAPSQ